MNEQSNTLFGRYQALRVYAAVAQLGKPEFSAGQISSMTGVAGGAVSKELAKLVLLQVIESTSRRGDYRRLDIPSFWEAVLLLAELWP